MGETLKTRTDLSRSPNVRQECRWQETRDALAGARRTWTTRTMLVLIGGTHIGLMQIKLVDYGIGAGRVANAGAAPGIGPSTIRTRPV